MNKLLLFIICLSFNAYSQFKVPCLTNKTQLDLSCACKKTKSCYSPLKKVDKKIYKLGSQSKMDKKLTKIVLRASKAEEALYGGKISPNDKQFKSLDKLNIKLGKARKKSVKKYEAFLRKKGAKMWKMKDRISYANKKLIEGIPLKKRNKLLKSGFQSSFAKFVAKNIGMKGFVPYRTDPKNGIIIAELDENKDLSSEKSIKIAGKNPDNSKYTVDTKNLDRTNKKNFKYNTIINKPESSIFKIISNRYALISNRLDQRAVSKSLNGANKFEILESFKNLLNKG